ncbi:hypothetical protein B0T09DRAFT_51792 [Sordaria sp. MPI-SDFR-AT-0083]|nr:hypothetical protein B0T09DRAFT_51792 [Sordaria sp. MPI-SDFR-AT-0083]
MATTFHLFPFLPWELRVHVWNMTVEPRVVEVHTHIKYRRVTFPSVQVVPQGGSQSLQAPTSTPFEPRVAEVHRDRGPYPDRHRWPDRDIK